MLSALKTPKTHALISFSPQPLFVKLELCRLCTGMPNPICVTDNAIHESHCSVQCFVLGYVIKDESDLQSFVISSSKHEMCFNVFDPSSVLTALSADAFLVFLVHLIFWMGMFKVFRWNKLEILIPKHMWKSIIGPVEQI